MYPELFSNSHKIVFNKENYMSKIVSFVGCDQLTIEGNEDKAAQIICNISDSGFYFDNVNHLTFPK